MNIKIIVEDENEEVIAKRETSNWEVAEQNLDSLKRLIEKKKAEKEQEEEKDDKYFGKRD